MMEKSPLEIFFQLPSRAGWTRVAGHDGLGGDDYHARLDSLADEADRVPRICIWRESLGRRRPLLALNLASPLERRSDALKGFTFGAKVRHKVYKVDALVIQLAAAGDFLPEQEKGPH